ncbi:MAG: tRNA lysidine(34) synthetase TilS [Arenimonas sp.]
MPDPIMLALNVDHAGPVLVGYSGGMDSTVLLHALCANDAARARGVRAIHVAHGLHPDAGLWTQHCRRFCEQSGIELIVEQVHVDRNLGQGLEGAAREARYAAFATHLRADECLALAHHRDDQAETVLLRLLRASGSQGLSSMRSLRVLAAGNIWRPLLDVARASLLEYARRHDLRWIEDSSNDDLRFDRNFLRHRILPVVAERWPQYAQALARSAQLLAEDAQLLEAEVDHRLAQVRTCESDALSVTGLLALDKPWRARVLRRWLALLGLPPLPGRAAQIIESELLLARADAGPAYRWAGATLRRWRDLLEVEQDLPAWPQNWRADWDGLAPLPLPRGDSLEFLSLGGAVPPGSRFTAARRQGGERITLPGRKHSHVLKKHLQEVGVPPWERGRMPLLLAQDGELLAAGDQILSASLALFCDQHRVRLHWRRRIAPADN